jgi:NADPH-ferrihemoprotein reductase
MLFHHLKASSTTLLHRVRQSHFQYRSLSSAPVHLRIVFGSQSGTAEAFANELEFDAQEANVSTELIDALRFKADDLIVKLDNPKKVVTAFVMACYGEGEPTDNAKKFFQSLHAVPVSETKRYTGANYAVFGLGNSQCFRDRYNVIGKMLDKKLEGYGAHRLVSLGLGDASPEAVGEHSMGECWLAWKQQLLNSLQNIPAESTVSATASAAAAPPSPSPAATSSEPTSESSSSSSSHSAPPTTTSAPLTTSSVPIALSLRQRAMIPANRMILMSTVSHVTQLFSKTDEMTAAVEVEFDLTKTSPLFASDLKEMSYNYFTQGLQPGDHIGVFAPNSKYVVERFALAAGLAREDLDTLPAPSSNNNEEEPPTTLRQLLTWQSHLSGVASITSIKLLQRWLKDQPNLPQTTQLFAQLESKYDSLVKEKGLDTATILDMIPKLPGPDGSPPAKLPVLALLKTLPTLNPRLYSITHMVLPSERAAATAAVENACPIAAKLQATIHSPTAADDYTKITLLCRLLRYRQTKSSANRVVDGVCSSYLTERLLPNQSEVAIFFRESNFHLPPPLPAADQQAKPAPVIMIAGGSGLAPFMSFLEERTRLLTKENLQIGKAALYFGCRNNDEYIFRDKLVSYLGTETQSASSISSTRAMTPLDRLVVSFSTHQANGIVSTNTEQNNSLHSHEILNPLEEHIPSVVLKDKEFLIPFLRQGGFVYVCGGAGQFGKAVREVVNALAIEAFGIDTNATTAKGEKVIHPGIRHLIAEKRYFEDLAD